MDSFLIMHGNFDNLEGQFARAEQQLVVTPKIFDSPHAEIHFHAFPVLAPKYFGAAKRVLDTLIQQERKDSPEELVADGVGEFHRKLRQRVDETVPVYKF